MKPPSRNSCWNYNATVTRVVDGDTFDCSIDLGFDLTIKQRVRVAGVDTPEKRTRDKEEKKLGLDATLWLEDKLNEAAAAGYGLIVRTELDKGSTGKYGRLLGWLYIGDADLSLNEEMIQEGFAWEYDGGTKKKDFEELRKIRRSKGTMSSIDGPINVPENCPMNPPEASGPGGPLMTPTDFIP